MPNGTVGAIMDDLTNVIEWRSNGRQGPPPDVEHDHDGDTHSHPNGHIQHWHMRPYETPEYARVYTRRQELQRQIGSRIVRGDYEGAGQKVEEWHEL